MTFNMISVRRGPSDDWDPQGYATDEDKVAEDLAELGMHTLDDKSKDKEAEEDGLIVVEVAADAEEDPDDEQEDAVNELVALDRAANALKRDEIVMPYSDEE